MFITYIQCIDSWSINHDIMFMTSNMTFNHDIDIKTWHWHHFMTSNMTSWSCFNMLMSWLASGSSYLVVHRDKPPRLRRRMSYAERLVRQTILVVNTSFFFKQIHVRTIPLVSFDTSTRYSFRQRVSKYTSGIDLTTGEE